jgi:6-phosphogluconolactonase
MDLIREIDATSLARRAAVDIVADISDVLRSGREIYAIAVSGGSTPTLMLRALATADVPWNKVHIFQVDERVTDPDSDDRNLHYLKHILLEKVKIPDANVHPMPVETGNLTTASIAYAEEIHRVTGDGILDLVHLGLGDDGHTASLPPGSNILEVVDRDVWYVPEFNGLPRMSLTYPVINRARKILWLVSGEGKRDAVRRLVAADLTIPAGHVLQENAALYADQAAVPAA